MARGELQITLGNTRKGKQRQRVPQWLKHIPAVQNLIRRVKLLGKQLKESQYSLARTTSNFELKEIISSKLLVEYSRQTVVMAQLLEGKRMRVLELLQQGAEEEAKRRLQNKRAKRRLQKAVAKGGCKLQHTRAILIFGPEQKVQP